MRFSRLLILALLLSFGWVEAAPAQASRPQFRPAVLGSGPDSLINRIDAKALQNAGMKDGAVMFSAIVAKDGQVVDARLFRPMPGSEPLEKEVSAKLRQSRLAPAIYNHQPVAVLLSGTAIFSVANDTPRLRIFLNQDPTELKNASDFIAPQPVFGPPSAFSGLDYPTDIPVQVSAVVDLVVKVDVQGELQDVRVLTEDPPLLGFAQLAVEDLTGARFVPAFRDGDAAATETVLPLCYQPPDWQVEAPPATPPPLE